jgi:hypothetical protein
MRERDQSHPLSKLRSVRRVATGVSRRIKKLSGATDNSPWVLWPSNGSSRKTYVDFLFGLHYLSPNSRLVRLLHEAMAPLGLNLLLVNDVNVERVIDQVRRGWLEPHVYLDLDSSTKPRFNDLASAAASRGVYVIDNPANLTTWTHKASSHELLAKAGLPLPPSVILRRGSADRDLTEAERSQIGESCVMKPSSGFGNRGVLVGVPSTAAQIAAARDFDRNVDWLIQ